MKTEKGGNAQQIKIPVIASNTKIGGTTYKVISKYKEQGENLTTKLIRAMTK